MDSGIRPLGALILLAVHLVGYGQEQPAVMNKQNSGVSLSAGYDPLMCAPDGVGVGGYDLVSYRSPAGPQPGRSEFSREHDGIAYQFLNEDNAAAFASNPERFLPAYGGFCAITLALGRLTCPDYTNYKIENDRLLLFETTGFTNGRVVWDTDPSGFRQQADSNFLEILAKP